MKINYENFEFFLPDAVFLEFGDVAEFWECENDDSRALDSHPGGSADTMHVVLRGGRRGELDDPVHFGQVQSSRGHVLRAQIRAKWRGAALCLWGLLICACFFAHSLARARGPEPSVCIYFSRATTRA